MQEFQEHLGTFAQLDSLRFLISGFLISAEAVHPSSTLRSAIIWARPWSSIRVSIEIQRRHGRKQQILDFFETVLESLGILGNL